MKIREFYQRQSRTFSFELFPPKTDEGEASLFETVKALSRLQPSFISVTYGAMGTTRKNTFRIASRIKNEFAIEAASHLTCVGHAKGEIRDILIELKETQGIENIVALRGDPPKGETQFKPADGGFRYASELVAFIRSEPAFNGHFSLAVAGYPECHVECRDKARDLEHLKIKVDAGADVVITQLFFDNADYFDFVGRARKAAISVPIVPGIMPVTSGKQIQKFTSMCGARLPQEMLERIEAFGENAASVEAYGIEYATRQCDELLRNGAPGIHFYTLNRSQATLEIYGNLGLARQN